MRAPPAPRCLAALATTLLLGGCFDQPVGVDGTATPPTAKAPRVDNTGISIGHSDENPDQMWARIAREDIPGFAGVVYEAGKPVLMTTRPELHAASVTRLRTLFPNERTLQQEIESRSVRYDFAQLRAWADLVKDDPAVSVAMTFLDVDSRSNLVRVGIDQDRDIVSVRESLIAMGIPANALAVAHRPPLEAEDNLQGYVRPIPGGVRIESSSICTLGVNVRADGLSGFAVTAAHCTGTVGSNYGAQFYQPDNYYGYVLEESVDPPTWTGGSCPYGRECRSSDSALLEYYSYFNEDEYYIAWPIGVGSQTFYDRAYQQAAWGETFILAYPWPGLSIKMVGQTSGLQEGQITDDCFGISQTGTNIWYPCMYGGSYDSASGDSGAPIITGGGSWANVYGIHAGRAHGDAAFSLWSEVRSDFARLGMNVRARP